MSKLIIMQGLPASGKSTRAEEILRADGNAVRLNRDLLRKMLHFGKWSGRNESATKDAQRRLAQFFLGQKKNVVIDDTNLNEGTLESWRQTAKDFEGELQYVKMDTTIDECIKRDLSREDSVGRSVIVGMAMANGLYPKPEKGIVICDLDGTLCNIDHRLHFVKNLAEGQKKDWKGFFSEIPSDTVNMNVLDMVMDYEGKGFEIFFVSGRSEDHREATEAWLEKTFKGYQVYKALFMRRADDRREDTEVKAQIFDRDFKDFHIEAVIDDRPSVIRMWKEKGLNVIDVGSGVEF